MTGTSNSTVSFRAPSEAEWRQLIWDGNGDDGTAQNRADLKNMLLASLQMQHLTVLSGLGCSLSAGGPSMGDLWKHAVGQEPSTAAIQIADTVKYNLEEKNIEKLLSQIEAFLQVFDDPNVDAFLNASKKVILEDCSGFPTVETLGDHKTFLHRLSRRRTRDQRLRVFTTNYDLSFEKAAGEIGSVALDGFSFAVPRHYDPRFFGYDIVRRPRSGDDLSNFLEGVFLLYKLHGSVNWARTAEGAIIEKETPEPAEACLIYPASGKYQQSYTQPHLEAMAQFLVAIREPNTCVVVVGFGFNDDHLAEPLLAAAGTNPHLRLIIVDLFAQANTTGGNKYWTRFSELARHGEDVWFISSSFADFAQLIPDLKALTPADTLMKAIQGATR